jgi:osmoprotectant transport system substrate-binding protein
MRPLFDRRQFAAALVGAALALASAAPAAAADSVKVGSKLDAEASVLGNIILQVLNAHGIATENKLQLGPTKIVRTALLSGEIDIYPEYTGNAAFFSNTDSDPAWKSLEAGYKKAKELDVKNKLVWLAAAPANNTWAIAVRQDVASANKLATVADFAKWVNAGGNVKLAGSAEFVESPAALPAFQSTYGFKLGPDQIVVLAGGDTSVFEKAAAEGTSGVNAAVAYGTDGAISALGLVALDDDKGAQIVYAPAPVVRAEVLAKHPEIGPALAPVFASLDAETLRKLNAEVSVDGKDAKAVAADYLKAKGFVK